MTPSPERAAAPPLAATGDAVPMRIGGLAVTPDRSGAAWIAEIGTLVVADLHLGKAAALAGRAVFLPPQACADTLARLAEAVRRRAPRRVICLGDSFHRPGGEADLDAAGRAMLQALAAGREWLWITGNHDPAPGLGLPGDSAAEWRVAGVVMRHEPRFPAGEAEIAGHLHPCARIVQRGRSLRRRCFLESGGHAVLPAFGALTGSLSVCDPAFRGAARRPGARIHMIGRDAVHAVPASRALPD